MGDACSERARSRSRASLLAAILVVGCQAAPAPNMVWIDDCSGECQVLIDASSALIEDAAVWSARDSIDVVGFVGQYEETYEIMPRIPSDMKKQAEER